MRGLLYFSKTPPPPQELFAWLCLNFCRLGDSGKRVFKYIYIFFKKLSHSTIQFADSFLWPWWRQLLTYEEDFFPFYHFLCILHIGCSMNKMKCYQSDKECLLQPRASSLPLLRSSPGGKWVEMEQNQSKDCKQSKKAGRLLQTNLLLLSKWLPFLFSPPPPFFNWQLESMVPVIIQGLWPFRPLQHKLH